MNRRTLKSEKLLSSSPSQKSALVGGGCNWYSDPETKVSNESFFCTIRYLFCTSNQQKVGIQEPAKMIPISLWGIVDKSHSESLRNASSYSFVLTLSFSLLLC